MGGDVCEELKKRMIDVCCMQELRWGGRRYELWWSGKGDGVVGEGGTV